MALSDDQRALLRLLVAGDTYERVAEMLGTSGADVRTRAHQAVSGLEREPDPELPLEAVRGRLDALEGASGAQPVVAPPSPPHASRRRLALWIVSGAAAVVLLIVVLVVRGGGGDGNDNTPPAGGGQEDAVPIRLTPVGGSHASGGLTIIRIADQPAVDLDIRGLTPTGRGQTYVLWFVGSGGRSLPIAFQAVGADGRITGRTPIPSAAAGLLPSFDTADLTLAKQSQAGAAVEQAARNGTLPQRVGTSVMRGTLRG
jgi:hypothetical protein